MQDNTIAMETLTIAQIKELFEKDILRRQRNVAYVKKWKESHQELAKERKKKYNQAYYAAKKAQKNPENPELS
jgi:hypothetical protein